ncbi:receptor activity-modifying protein 1 [Parambassis ranga]|uniref:Receptor activity-modifying protein 1 n=1 Tax=Parambassis ranga TaxID=210632 RepID=A0A6P7KC19_9TELE|nr:receptor activity-modifying protein 1-like [Parambassis ranga]
MTLWVTDRPQRFLLSTMILYLLLFPSLMLGIAELQSSDISEEEQAGDDLKTLINGTSSLYQEEKNQLKDNLQSNQTTDVIAEDDESFQDQENLFSGNRCQRDLLVEFSHYYCGEDFHKEMQTINKDTWCVLENIIRPYNNLTVCLERLSHLTGCFFPNPQIQDFFLYIHSIYFKDCTEEELVLEDAPHGLVITLTLIPVSLIPILVYMVVWKSKVQT